MIADSVLTIADSSSRRRLAVAYASVGGPAYGSHEVRKRIHGSGAGPGFSLDGKSWLSCRPLFLLSVDVLSALFRGLFLAKLRAAYQAAALQFFGKHIRLIDPRAFAAYLAPLWNTKWVVYCKPPSAARSRCCAISPATPTASPSPTAA